MPYILRNLGLCEPVTLLASHPNFSSLSSEFFTNQPWPIFPDSSTIIPSFPQTICTPYWTHLCSCKNPISFTDCSLYLQGLSSTLPCLVNSLPFKTYLTSHLLTEAFFLTLPDSHTFLHPPVALCTCLCYTTYYIISEWWVSISPTKPRELTCHTLLHLQCFMWGKGQGGDPVPQKVT